MERLLKSAAKLSEQQRVQLDGQQAHGYDGQVSTCIWPYSVDYISDYEYITE